MRGEDDPLSRSGDGHGEGNPREWVTRHNANRQVTWAAKFWWFKVLVVAAMMEVDTFDLSNPTGGVYGDNVGDGYGGSRPPRYTYEHNGSGHTPRPKMSFPYFEVDEPHTWRGKCMKHFAIFNISITSWVNTVTMIMDDNVTLVVATLNDQA